MYGKINTKCKINHLAKGGIYYVRVRTFYKNGKSFVYSRWSNRKKVEIPLAVILTASDYQKDKRDPSSIFENILDRIYDDNYRISNVILCGDYSRKHGSYGLKADNYVNQIKEILKNKDSAIDADGGIYVQGNHDRWSDTLTRDGLYYYKDYIVYVMNTGSSNPNHQGSEDQQYVMKKTADRLKRDMQKLIDDHEDRPVIIASHVPLHYSVRTLGKHGDNMYSKYLFDAVNKAGKKLNIVFLFGHNHSAGYDNYIGASCVYLHKGDRIELPFPNAEDSAKGCTSRHSSKTLNFTYMNAGYVGYMGKNASNSILSCGVIKVFNDRLEIVRYGELGKTDLSGEKH